MQSPIAALQAALFQRLSTDTNLQALLQSGGIHDHHPRGAEFPYIVFGSARTRDWSTSTEEGSEHVVSLHIWSGKAARSEVQAIQQQVSDLLKDAALTLTDHHLVNLAVTANEISHDGRSRNLHGVVRLRAVTEPIVI